MTVHGNTLAHELDKMGDQRDALADLSGVMQPVIATIELARGEPSLRDAVALARAPKIDVEDLLPWRQD